MGSAAYNRASNVIRQRIDFDSSKANRSLSGSVNHPVGDKQEPVATERRFEVGDSVYCKIGQFKYWPVKVTAVKRGNCFKADRIKVSGFGPWCPAYNFQYEQPK